jgi:hypothetical protein
VPGVVHLGEGAVPQDAAQLVLPYQQAAGSSSTSLGRGGRGRAPRLRWRRRDCRHQGAASAEGNRGDLVEPPATEAGGLTHPVEKNSLLLPAGSLSPRRFLWSWSRAESRFFTLLLPPRGAFIHALAVSVYCWAVSMSAVGGCILF